MSSSFLAACAQRESDTLNSLEGNLATGLLQHCVGMLFSQLVAEAATTTGVELAVTTIKCICSTYMTMYSITSEPPDRALLISADLQTYMAMYSLRMLEPPECHTLLITAGLIPMLSKLLLLEPIVAEDLDYFVLSVIACLCAVLPDLETGWPRGRTYYQRHTAKAEKEARCCCAALVEAGAVPKILRLARGKRSYLESARALYVLRQMSAADGSVATAVAKSKTANATLCAAAKPGVWEQGWTKQVATGLPAYHRTIVSGSALTHSERAVLPGSLASASVEVICRNSGAGTRVAELVVPSSDLERDALLHAATQQEHALQCLAQLCAGGALPVAGVASPFALISAADGKRFARQLTHDEGWFTTIHAIVCERLTRPLVSEGTHVGGHASTRFSTRAGLQLLAGIAKHENLAKVLIRIEGCFGRPSLARAISHAIALPTLWPVVDCLVLCKTLCDHSDGVFLPLLKDPIFISVLPSLVDFVGPSLRLAPLALSVLRLLLTRDKLPPRAVLKALASAGLCADLIRVHMEDECTPDARDSSSEAAQRASMHADAQLLYTRLASGPLQNALPNPSRSATSLSSTGPEAAMALKERANVAVRRGQYEEAAALYTEGLRQVPSQCDIAATLCGNRALCHLRLHNPDAAERDCSRAIGYMISVDSAPSAFFVKCCFRRATALGDRYARDADDEEGSDCPHHSLKRAETDLAACLHNNGSNREFLALKKRLASIQDEALGR